MLFPVSCDAFGQSDFKPFHEVRPVSYELRNGLRHWQVQKGGPFVLCGRPLS